MSLDLSALLLYPSGVSDQGGGDYKYTLFSHPSGSAVHSAGGVSDSSFVNLFRESKWTRETTVEPQPRC